MFWNRVWMETRIRMLYGIGAMVFVVGLFHIIYASGKAGPGATYVKFIWNAVIRSGLFMSWPVFAFVVGTVGLVAQCSRVQAMESNTPSMRFLLTLPIERWRLLMPRILVALAEVVALALFTVGLLVLAAFSVGETYPPDLAVKVLLLLMMSGLPSASLGVLLSIRIQNTTRAILTGYGIIFAVLMTMLIWGEPLKRPPAFGNLLAGLTVALSLSFTLCMAARRVLARLEV